jgi:hypothetical protein
VDLKNRDMGWLLCVAAISVALFYVVAEKTPVSEEHHNTEEDGTLFTAGHHRFGAVKSRELAPAEDQMN